jgi:hypothetical protein
VTYTDEEVARVVHEWDATQWLKLGRDIIRNSEGKAA